MDKSLKTEKTLERMSCFEDYIRITGQSFFNFFFSDGSVKKVPYRHRWEKSYRRAILAKLYALDLWCIRTNQKFGMLSLTTSQAGLSDYDILMNLKNAWSLFADNIGKMGLKYVMLYEPHMENKTGVPHIHVFLIGDIDNEKVERLRGLWHDKYCMGHPDYDFNYTDGIKKVDSVVNYLMKYLSKTVLKEMQNEPALLRFHSLFWESGKRMWSSSRDITKVMRYVKKKSRDSEIYLEKITLCSGWAPEKVMYEDNIHFDLCEELYQIFSARTDLDILDTDEKWHDHCWGKNKYINPRASSL